MPAALGSSAVGLFFTLSTATLIVIRLLGGMVFDRFPKLHSLRISSAALALCLALLANADSAEGLALLAVLYGLLVGVSLPLLNAVLFMASPPALRGVNANLTLFMMDAGFFLSPWLGGAFLAVGGAVSRLFTGCAVVISLAVGLLLAVRLNLGDLEIMMLEIGQPHPAPTPTPNPTKGRRRHRMELTTC